MLLHPLILLLLLLDLLLATEAVALAECRGRWTLMSEDVAAVINEYPSLPLLMLLSPLLLSLVLILALLPSLMILAVSPPPLAPLYSLP
jgi:hypothetical protein